MREIRLNRSKVKFVEDPHQYFLDGKELQGVTGTLIRKAFPDTYKGAPERAMAEAAERGSMIHQSLELLCTVYDSDINAYPDPTQELRDFSGMLQSYGLRHIESEYIVSDDENFASAIDGVFADGDDNIYLVDYKTTSALHYDNVSLQLSIYAEWFERMNPGLEVKELVCMWFKKGQSKFQPLPRVEGGKIEELAAAYLAGDEDYRYEVEIPGDFHALEREYRLVTARLDALKTQQDDVKERMMRLMEDSRRKTIRTDSGSYTYVPAAKTRRFDAKRFGEEAPDEYEKYMKESETKASIRITLKK